MAPRFWIFFLSRCHLRARGQRSSQTHRIIPRYRGSCDRMFRTGTERQSVLLFIVLACSVWLFGVVLAFPSPYVYSRSRILSNPPLPYPNQLCKATAGSESPFIESISLSNWGVFETAHLRLHPGPVRNKVYKHQILKVYL